jgi:hypothetical protein
MLGCERVEVEGKEKGWLAFLLCQKIRRLGLKVQLILTRDETGKTVKNPTSSSFEDRQCPALGVK